VIWGENGSGKTAVLEAIHTLSFGKSFRTHKQREMIRSSDESLIIRGDFLSNKHPDKVAIEVKRSSGQKIKIKREHPVWPERAKLAETTWLFFHQRNNL
jgi:Recombinational DNA repair ATPase (RecF pathway)